MWGSLFCPPTLQTQRSEACSPHYRCPSWQPAGSQEKPAPALWGKPGRWSSPRVQGWQWRTGWVQGDGATHRLNCPGPGTSIPLLEMGEKQWHLLQGSLKGQNKAEPGMPQPRAWRQHLTDSTAYWGSFIQQLFIDTSQRPHWLGH